MPTGFKFPSDFDPQNCALIAVPISMMPFIAGAVASLRERPVWDTVEDWIAAYGVITQVEGCLMQTCAMDLTKGLDRLYMLLDGAFYGHTYTATGDPLVISPPIPDVPDTEALADGIVFKTQQTFEMLDNSINGTVYLSFSDENSIKARLQAILDGMTAENEVDAEQLAELVQILAALA